MSSLDFRPEVLEAQKTSIWGTVLVKPHAFYERAFQAIVLITLLFFALLFLGHYSTKETVKGIIEPKEGLVSLYAQQSGYIENLYAQQGESVRLQEKILSISDHQQLEQGQEYVDVLKKQIGRAHV